MNILCFDTSFTNLYITLGNSNDILFSEIIEPDQQNYASVKLIPNIAEYLNKFKLQMKDINVIGVNVGPGSFTGVRASVTIAKVFASLLDIPIFSVNSLEILSKINTSDKRTLVILDARKNQAYFGVKKDNEIIVPKILPYCEIKNEILDNDFVITDSNSFKVFPDSLNFELHNFNLGLLLYDIVFDKVKNKIQPTKPENLSPMYLQKPFINCLTNNRSL